MTAPCPRCQKTKRSKIVTLTHPSRGVLFQGCPDCLIAELDELRRRRSDPCWICGTTKAPVQFDQCGELLECPLHAHGRALLGRALQILRKLGGPGRTEVNTLCLDLVDALGVREREEA